MKIRVDREIPIIYNGLVCPLCESELVDCDPNIILLSHPPRVATCCSNEKCEFRGSRRC